MLWTFLKTLFKLKINVPNKNNRKSNLCISVVIIKLNETPNMIQQVR